MVEAGLLGTKTKLNKIELQNFLTSKLGNEEKAREIMESLGLKAALENENISTVKLTSSKLQLAVTTGKLNAEQAKEIALHYGIMASRQTKTLKELILLKKAENAETLKAIGLKAKEAAASVIASPVGQVAIVVAITGILTQLANKLNKEVFKSIGQNEALEKRIESLNEDYSKNSSQLDEINSKLSENEEKIRELSNLENPTYVDEEELEKLREQNKLLKEIAQYKQEDKDNSAQKKNEALTEKFRREYLTTEADDEELVEYDDSFFGGLLDTITFKGLFGGIKAITNTSQAEKDKNVIESAEGLRDLQDALLDESQLEFVNQYSELVNLLNAPPSTDYSPEDIENQIQQLKESTNLDFSLLEDLVLSGIDVTDYNAIQDLINKNDEQLKKIRTELLDKLSEYDETDPYYQSEGARALVGLLDGVNKYLNPDDWIKNTVDKVYGMDNFSEITKAIETKLSDGEIISVEDLLTDESYHNLVKRIALELYNTADDESLTRAATYLHEKISSLVSGEEIIVKVSFTEAFNSEDFSEQKEKLLELATAGELTPETLETTEEYKTLLTQTGKSAEVLVDKISKLNVQLKENEVDSLSDTLEKIKSGASLSAEEIAELVSENDELASAIKITKDGYTLEEDAIVSLINSNIELYNTSVANEIERTKKQIELAKTRIETIKEEIKANQSLIASSAYTLPNMSQNTPYDATLLLNGGITDSTLQKNTILEDLVDDEEARINTLNEYLEQLFKEPYKEQLEDSSKTTKDSTDNIFDWIETRISRLQNAFQNMVDSVTKYVSQNFKLDNIDKQIASLDKQISTYYAGAEKYLEKANSITLSDDLRNKVINGKIEIEEISDETTREAVTEFKEWYEKYLDAIDNAAQLERDKRDKLREKLDARTWALQQQRERLSTKSDRKQDAIDFKESLEGSANTSEYQWLINNADKQYENINAENSLLKEYLATLDSTSEEWADIQSQIESNESSMRDLISSQVEWNNKIAQMPIDKAEKAIEKLGAKEDYINAKYENTTSSYAKRQLNDTLAGIKEDTLKQYRNAYETTKDNFNTSAYNINQMSSKDSLVAKVQKYTKSGKEIPSDVLSSVYGSGNTLLIRRCEQYNAAYLARETAKDTYDLNKEQIKTDLADLGQKNLDTITDAYANKNTTIDNKKSLINARKENTEAKGKYADESYYNQLLTQVSRQVDAKVSERNKLKEIIDQNIKDGLWTKESQMYKDAMAQVDQLGIEIVELSTEQANYNNELNQMPIDRLQTALDILDKLSSRDASKNDLKKALGKDLSVDDYQKEFNNIKKQEDKTLQLRNKYYQKYINAKQKGRDADADKYLQLYYEEDTALNNLKVSFEELKDEMRDDVYWRDFERAHKAAENLKTTIASIIDLYSDEMLFTDNGALTDMGVSKMGALLKEYELAKTEVVNYTNDLKNLNNLYENGLYPNEEEYKEKLAEIKNGLLDATKETKNYNDALRDMVISQKEIELEALNELIDKRKEALNAKKEYYDYDKNIKEKTKEIQSLQAQVAALEGVETAEAKSQLARAKSELQEAQDDLEETKFDHKLEVILDGFDLLQTDLQENHDAYVKNLKSSFDEQIEIISNANSLIGQSYSEVIRSITNMLQFYGVDTSSIDVGSLAGFATGGIVRAVRRNGDSALVSVNPDETILTKKFTDLLPDTVQMMSQFVNIPKMNYDFVPRRNDTPVINISYDKMLHIEGNVFDMEKATMDVVKNNMKTIAKGVSNDLSTQWRKLGHK